MAVKPKPQGLCLEPAELCHHAGALGESDNVPPVVRYGGRDNHPLPYVDHFGLSPADLRSVLGLALASGGDFAEIFMEYRTYDFINMEEDIIKETAEAVSIGLGIRVIAATGRASATRTTCPSTRSARPPRRPRPSPAARPPALRPRPSATGPGRRAATSSAVPPTRPPSRAKMALVREAYAAAQGFDKRIAKVKAHYSDSLKHMCIANSEGLLVRDTRPMVKLVCVAISEKDGKRESGYWGGGGRVGLEYFRDVLTPRRIGEEAAREAVLLLEAADAPAGEMPIVLAPGHSGVLIHEAVGHLLEADFNRKKTSVFWNKMGKKVGSPLVTIYDDPTIPAFRGSYNIDDEGTPRARPCSSRRASSAACSRTSSRPADARPPDRARPAPGLQPRAHPADGQHLHRRGRRRARGHPPLGQEGLLRREPLGRPGRGLGQVHLLGQPRLPHRGRQADGARSSRRPSSARTSTS